VSFGNIYRLLFTIYNLIVRKNTKSSKNSEETKPLMTPISPDDSEITNEPVNPIPVPVPTPANL